MSPPGGQCYNHRHLETTSYSSHSAENKLYYHQQDSHIFFFSYHSAGNIFLFHFFSLIQKLHAYISSCRKAWYNFHEITLLCFRISHSISVSTKTDQKHCFHFSIIVMLYITTASWKLYTICTLISILSNMRSFSMHLKLLYQLPETKDSFIRRFLKKTR